MREVFPQLRGLLAGGEPFAVATVFRVEGSAPRSAGASLVVTADGAVVGSVSGGCVEGAVYELCRLALEDGRSRTERFGVDDDPFAVGLTCGGTLDVLVRPFTAADGDLLRRAVEAEAGGRATVLATVVGPAGSARLGRTLLVDAAGTAGTLGDADLDRSVEAAARAALRRGDSGAPRPVGCADGRYGEVDVFLEVVAPPPRLLVFGAVEPAGALTRLAKFLGYHVTVCDARGLFATRARFPDADEVVVQWPAAYLRATAVDERTVVCVLTHDEKFDVPLLEEALRGPAGYVGALGSRRTHRDRLSRLTAAGVRAEQLERLSSPLGLDLGARTPEETAVSIVAEIIAHRHGGSGARLSRSAGPIHRADTSVPSIVPQVRRCS
ncbi:xanthine dehydrogenase accessory factor [Kineococcus radiotolerans]|uniref:Xanthine dehydrogenase accessory factor n=1 Tax=Kineococcus radiotolerans TaxID=131568 RepID=A0A7W4TI41_KINRA|nr:XdhC/CoxI family protein [Kineococcus radiotolerans]MBB2899320.1 xanthine dehydrogenase accessory factor [Kineococcus radiotolerans]